MRSSEGRRAAGRACSQVERAARSTLPLGGRERGCEVGVVVMEMLSSCSSRPRSRRSCTLYSTDILFWVVSCPGAGSVEGTMNHLPFLGLLLRSSAKGWIFITRFK